MSNLISDLQINSRILYLVLDLDFLQELLTTISYPNLNCVLNFIFDLAANIPEMKSRLTKSVLHEIFQNYIEMSSVNIMRLEINDRKFYEEIMLNRNELNAEKDRIEKDFQKQKHKLEKLDRSPKIKTKSKIKDMKEDKQRSKGKSRRKDEQEDKQKSKRKSKKSVKFSSDEIFKQIVSDYKQKRLEIEKIHADKMKDLYKHYDELKDKILHSETDLIISKFIIELNEIDNGCKNELPLILRRIPISKDLDILLIIFPEMNPILYSRFITDSDFLELKSVLDLDIILHENEDFIRLLGNFVLLENRKISTNLNVQDFIRNYDPDFLDKIISYLK